VVLRRFQAEGGLQPLSRVLKSSPKCRYVALQALQRWDPSWIALSYMLHKHVELLEAFVMAPGEEPAIQILATLILDSWRAANVVPGRVPAPLPRVVPWPLL
jgi:hypothetical protein